MRCTESRSYSSAALVDEDMAVSGIGEEPEVVRESVSSQYHTYEPSTPMRQYSNMSIQGVI